MPNPLLPNQRLPAVRQPQQQPQRLGAVEPPPGLRTRPNSTTKSRSDVIRELFTDGTTEAFIQIFAEAQNRYAEAKANSESAYEKRKLIHATLQNESAGSEAGRLREATGSEKYQVATEEYLTANREMLMALSECKVLDVAFEAWRTASANERRTSGVT